MFGRCFSRGVHRLGAPRLWLSGEDGPNWKETAAAIVRRCLPLRRYGRFGANLRFFLMLPRHDSP